MVGSSSAGDPAVLIVGAGPVGLTMACELARHGVACRIVDSGEGPTDQSRALAIQARTLEVFENVGVVEAILSRARKVRGMQAYADGKRLLHVNFDLEGMETHYPFLLILPQSETERVLLDRLREHRVEVERRSALVGLSQDASGVTASLIGADGQAETVRARWLVGCDGARSVARKAIGLTFEGAEYEETFLLADVRVKWDRPDDEFTIVLTPDGPIVAFPLPEAGRWRLVDGSGVAAEDADPARVVARFGSLLREHGRPEAVVSDPSWTSAFRIHRRVADRFRAGRCFVAGDAAHIHSPAGGQGMNTGIQDAYNLAWKLGLVDRGASPDSLLDSYSPERRSAVAGVVQGSHLATSLVTLRNPLARSIRNHLASLLGEFDFVGRRLSRDLSELGVAYPESPIVAEDRPRLLSGPVDALDFRHGPKPGDRVPDVALGPAPGSGDPERLHELLRGTKHVLLLFGEVGEAVGGLAREHAEEVDTYRVSRDPVPDRDGRTIHDPGGGLHRRFGVHSSAVYLIRPDGYLAYRAAPPDPARLAAYLSRVFVKTRAR